MAKLAETIWKRNFKRTRPKSPFFFLVWVIIFHILWSRIVLSVNKIWKSFVLSYEFKIWMEGIQVIHCILNKTWVYKVLMKAWLCCGSTVALHIQGQGFDSCLRSSSVWAFLLQTYKLGISKFQWCVSEHVLKCPVIHWYPVQVRQVPGHAPGLPRRCTG